MPTEPPAPPVRKPAPTAGLLEQLLAGGLVHPDDWAARPPEERGRLLNCPNAGSLLGELVAAGLLTPYQAAHLACGAAGELVLGNYRILDRLGDGPGVVYRAEHAHLRRPVVVKLLSPAPGELGRLLARSRALARLAHPRVLAPCDAGEVPPGGPAEAGTPYLITDYVPGRDLRALVRSDGPLPPDEACELVYEAADALRAPHRRGLAHGRLKPANVLVTPDGQVHLLDFGLAAAADADGYRAPELAAGAAGDERADVFALGGLLFWCLTGRDPGHAPRPALRDLCPDAPPELEGVFSRLTSPHPAERYADAAAVMRALRPFLPDEGEGPAWAGPNGRALAPSHRVLIVDDEDSLRNFCRAVLATDGLLCREAACGAEALDACRREVFDLVILDVHLPDLSGFDVLRRLRAAPRRANLKVIVASGVASPDAMAQMLLAGADHYLTKPFSLVQLRASVQTVLRLKDAQDRSDLLTSRLMGSNLELEHALQASNGDLVEARNALVLALAKLVEQRSTETGTHLIRLQRFARCLAEAAAGEPALAGQIDTAFVELLEPGVPLHDIGKVAVPDAVLLKPGKLTPEERLVMQAHTIAGAETLRAVARQHGVALPFLHMAIDVARHHHERYDGTGYPDRLAGSAIPLAARIVAIADVYDALRAPRVYKPGFTHAETVRDMVEESPGHFDPVLLRAFERVAPRFEQIYRELVD
jgi:response regulator RpfG family c-di-GMP phosphodiesterase